MIPCQHAHISELRTSPVLRARALVRFNGDVPQRSTPRYQIANDGVLSIVVPDGVTLALRIGSERQRVSNELSISTMWGGSEVWNRRMHRAVEVKANGATVIRIPPPGQSKVPGQRHPVGVMVALPPGVTLGQLFKTVEPGGKGTAAEIAARYMKLVSASNSSITLSDCHVRTLQVLGEYPNVACDAQTLATVRFGAGVIGVMSGMTTRKFDLAKDLSWGQRPRLPKGLGD